jgi:hypothetical protein
MKWDAPRAAALALLTVLACDRQNEPTAPPRPAPAPSTPVTVSSSSPPPELDVRHHVIEGFSIHRGVVEANPLWDFIELDVDLGRIRLEIASRPGGATLDTLLPKDALAVINGGYFDANLQPTTWVKSGGTELAPRSPTTKGGVFAISGERAFIGPLSALTFDPDLAVQSFPLIVELDGSPGIRRDDGKGAFRTIVCTTTGPLRFIVITSRDLVGPTLHESMTVLLDPPPRGFGCTSALNLDGGPSTGVWFASSIPVQSRPSIKPVSYGIAFLPR